MGICEHGQGDEPVPRTMDSWRRGLLTDDLSELKARAADGDVDAQAQLAALNNIELLAQFSPPR